MIDSWLGPYRIDAELGSGGMGKVYAATVDGRVPGVAHGTRVAVKVIHPHLLETQGFFQRFLREAQIGALIRHENVVRTHLCDQLVVEGVLNAFLVMEYVEGQTLRELLDELERVPEELCRHVGREICKGLAAVHAAGVIHRDMKPDNVLITTDHVVKVMDLGVARLTDEALRLTRAGAFVGSIHYAAPECFKDDGKHVDTRADLHALGLVLYELSSGVNPYYAARLPQILQRVLHDAPRRLGDLNPQLSPFFEEVVHRLLAKDPDERFASAGEVLAVLEAGEESVWWGSRARQLQETTSRPLRRIRIPRETAVYGREGELATLRGLFEQAGAGDGQVVLLEGEAGIGKSRLIDELIVRLQQAGEDLNFLFGSYPPGGAASAAGALSTAFREHMGEQSAAVYLAQTPVLVPAFDAVLRGDSVPAGAEPLTQDSLVTCFVQAARALAAERPTVILIDDLHFAPADAHSLFCALAMAVPGHRILLIGSTRPGAEGAWRGNLARFDYVHHLQVERLFPKDLVELLRDSFKSEALASALAGQIAIKSDGNPFFAFEIVRGLREGQFITQSADGSWTSTRRIEEIQIPSSVLELVNARVADLTEDERDLLDVASCCGFEFDPLIVAAACGLPHVPALKRLGQIERRHRLVRSQGRSYAFDHHQVQEALYGGLNEYLREAYHGGLADALEARAGAADKDPELLDGGLCVQLCDHLLKGAQGERALRYLARAHAHLTGGYVHAQAAALSELALAAPGLLTGAARAQALLRLVVALDSLGRRARQEQCAREAEELAAAAGDNELQVRAASSLGWCLHLVSRAEEAEEVLRRAVDIAVARGDRAAEANAIGHMGLVLWSVGRFDAAREQLERQLLISRELGDRKVEARASGNLGLVFKSLGQNAESRAQHERQLVLSGALGDRPGVAITTGNLGNVAAALGDFEQSQVLQERHLALSREIGYRYGELIALHNLGNVCFERGDTARAEECLRGCLALSEESDQPYGAALSLLKLGPVRAAAGDAEGERATVEAARDRAAASGLASVEACARCYLASLPGVDPQDGVAAFEQSKGVMTADERREAAYLLWVGTRDLRHLVEAKRLLDTSVARVDAATRQAMFTNLRINREIVAACTEAGI